VTSHNFCVVFNYRALLVLISVCLAKKQRLAYIALCIKQYMLFCISPDKEDRRERKLEGFKSWSSRL